MSYDQRYLLSFIYSYQSYVSLLSETFFIVALKISSHNMFVESFPTTRSRGLVRYFIVPLASASGLSADVDVQQAFRDTSIGGSPVILHVIFF